jgi:hypothetical protein
MVKNNVKVTAEALQEPAKVSQPLVVRASARADFQKTA